MAADFSDTYKILVIGDVNVGKTCLVHRFCDERYYDTYISTVGEFRTQFNIILYIKYDYCTSHLHILEYKSYCRSIT